jgi:hypothetical protein
MAISRPVYCGADNAFVCRHCSALAIVFDYNELRPKIDAPFCEKFATLAQFSLLHQNPTTRLLTFSLHMHACVGATGKKFTIAGLSSWWMLIAPNLDRVLNYSVPSNDNRNKA